MNAGRIKLSTIRHRPRSTRVEASNCQQSCWNNQLEGGGCNLKSLELVSRRWGAPQPDDPSRTKARPDLEPRALILLARFVEQRGHQSLPGPLPHLRHLAWRPD